MKLNKITVIIIAVVILIGSLVSIFVIPKYRSRKMVESRLELDLPDDSKILKYTYKWGSDEVYAKILIQNDKLDQIKAELYEFFGGTARLEYFYMPDIKHICSWWDIDNNSVLYHFVTIRGGTSNLFFIIPPKTRSVYAFISKDGSGNYLLYVNC